MTHIIDISAPTWKTEEYADMDYAEADIQQHLVRVADFVTLRDNAAEAAGPVSETSYIGAYEYAPGGGVSDHVHPHAEQWYYILGGQGTMKVGDEEKTVGGGHVVFVPRNAVHSYTVVGDEPMRLLNVAIPVSAASEDEAG